MRNKGTHSRYVFSLAEPEDDLQLRHCMANNAMGDGIKVSFRREPNYFDACKLQGHESEVMVCKDTQTNEIVGLGSRFFLNAFINGKPQEIGYLADLRAEAHVRRSTLLARAYRYLKVRHQQRTVPFYYSLILSNNSTALNQLTSARAGLPSYKHLGKILTPAIHLDLPKPKISIKGISFTTANESNITEVIDFIRNELKQKQLAPAYTLKDFHSDRLKGLNPEDIYVAYQDEKIIATTAAWDQNFARQTHIEDFSPAIQFIKPFYNCLAKISPLKPIPNKGEKIPYLYLSMIAIKGNDVSVFRALLRHVYRERRQSKWHYAIAGLHENDPLAKCLLEYRHIPASGELFIVQGIEGFNDDNPLDQRLPYIEIATI